MNPDLCYAKLERIRYLLALYKRRAARIGNALHDAEATLQQIAAVLEEAPNE